VVEGVPLINPLWSKNCPIGQNCEPYFNPAAFMRPVKGQLGSAPRSFDGARGPTQHFLDLSIQKNFSLGGDGKRRLQVRIDAINAFNHPIFRIGRLEDAGEIFAAPNEGLLSNADYDAWAAAVPGRPARATPAGAATLARINAIVTSNRIPGTNSLVPNFFHIQLPQGFHSLVASGKYDRYYDSRRFQALSDASVVHARPLGIPGCDGRAFWLHSKVYPDCLKALLLR
jgi:hypothetical protein